MGNIFAIADWHAEKAISAYHRGEYDDYCRHIQICDALRRRAYKLRRAA